MPNGKQVKVKTYQEQQSGVEKLFIEDWKRKGYCYETVFEGETHHLVRDKDKPDFRIETNFREVIEPKLNLHTTTNFEKKQPRKDKDVLQTLNESRFDIINKSPSNLSSIPRVQNFDFKTHSARKPHLFGKTDRG